MRRFLYAIILLLSLPMSSFAQGWPANYGGVMLQGFYWNSYSDTKWTNLESQADELAKYFDLVWIPNSAKASASTSMGYDDLYWFTNYTSTFGTESELRSMINTFKSKGIGTIADVVINHRGNVSNWVDFPSETYKGVTYQLKSTDICANDDEGKAKAWANQNGYSLSNNDDTGEDWIGMRDLDHNSANVQTCVKAYLNFLLNDLGYAGVRYDMTKGYAGKFTGMYNASANPAYSVGEYWNGNVSDVETWLSSTKVNDNIMSAAFDFPIRYTVRDAVNSGTWSILDRNTSSDGGLCKADAYKRYAVTFVENHDTQYRSSTETLDPIKKDTLAANAYILAMPGTPCIFLKHWQAYKSEIGNMIKIRKAVGITNTSSFITLGSSNNYYMMKIMGSTGKSLIAILGNVSDAETASPDIITGYTRTLFGKNFAYYTNNTDGSYCVDKTSGTYGGSVDVNVNIAGNATVVYTTDGSLPSATNGTKLTSSTKLTFGTTTTLKIALLYEGELINRETYNYKIVDFEPYDITVYVNTDNVGWTSVNFWTWNANGTHKPSNTEWPGDNVSSTTTVAGKNWYSKNYTISTIDDYVNFVFSTGTGSPQTVNMEKINKTSYFQIASTKDSNGHYNVTDITTATNINPVLDKDAGNKDGNVYNLQGMKVGKSLNGLQKGIYIVNNKKYIVR